MIYTIETILTQQLHDDVYKKWYRQHVIKPFALYALWFPLCYLAALGLLRLKIRIDEAFINGFFVAMLLSYAHWIYSEPVVIRICVLCNGKVARLTV
jgi:hypothetical protein